MIFKTLLIILCLLITCYLNMKLYRKVINYIMKSEDYNSVLLIGIYILSLAIQSIVLLGIGAFILNL